MRGYSLSHSTVVEALQPFLVAAWAGFRLEEAPEPIRRHATKSQFGPNAQGGPKSNIRIFIFDEKGGLVLNADAFPDMNASRWAEAAPRHVVAQVRTALSKMGREGARAPLREVSLPQARRGIRVFSGLEKKKSSLFDAPYVEVEELSEEAWARLGKGRAADWKSVFAHVYPPGFMDRAARGGRRQELRAVEGTWTLKPAGSDGRFQYAVLSGKAKLVYGGFSYEGTFEAVIASENGEVRNVLGVFEAVYPRSETMDWDAADLPFGAVFETSESR